MTIFETYLVGPIGSLIREIAVTILEMSIILLRKTNAPRVGSVKEGQDCSHFLCVSINCVIVQKIRS